MTYNYIEKWTRPSNYAGPNYPEYYVFLGRNRNSDILTESNFRCGLAIIGGETETVLVIRDRHWAVGWIEYILIHESDTIALQKADEILKDLKNYPVINEDDFSEREAEEANQIWKDCYIWQDRIRYIREDRYQFEFHNFQEMLAVVRGEYFNGYVSEMIY